MVNFYDYQRPLGQITDDTKRREQFIVAFDQCTKDDIVRFGLRYIAHLFLLTGLDRPEEVNLTIASLERWLDKKTNFHESRNISYRALIKKAQVEQDITKELLYKTLAQITCIPHVKFHGLWASDFAIKLINHLFPNNVKAIESARQQQIEILKCEINFA
jgi:hypothetical protein